MESKKIKKTFLLNTNEELFNRFRKLCEDEGFNTTVVLNYMMKSAVDKQVLWQYIRLRGVFSKTNNINKLQGCKSHIM